MYEAHIRFPGGRVAAPLRPVPTWSQAADRWSENYKEMVRSQADWDPDDVFGVRATWLRQGGLEVDSGVMLAMMMVVDEVPMVLVVVGDADDVVHYCDDEQREGDGHDCGFTMARW